MPASSSRPVTRPRRLRASSSDLKRVSKLLIATVLVVVPATAAVAKSFWIANADVTVVVNDDGSLNVTELLTFDFSGDFSGAYRDIPLRPGESIEITSVGDQGGSYSTGGCTSLGCSSPAGLYGVEQHRDFVRVVWHHESRNELRTFKLVYHMRGLVSVYDDVVDVNIQVWGDQWAVGLDRLTARMMIPNGAEGGDVLVAVSSSGKSENILRGVAAARQEQCKVITLSGFAPDNPLDSLGDINFYAPAQGVWPGGNSTPINHPLPAGYNYRSKKWINIK